MLSWSRSPGRGRWEFWVLCALAAAMVYPDKVADWIEESFGMATGLVGVILVELAAIGGMSLLVELSKRIEWAEAGFILAMVGLFRMVFSVAWEAFGWRD